MAGEGGRNGEWEGPELDDIKIPSHGFYLVDLGNDNFIFVLNLDKGLFEPANQGRVGFTRMLFGKDESNGKGVKWAC
ncbi:hypothetical protein L6452_03275 [Arctium lappa]|uniref:Uncharacterized protein n=1 Tax=Arctium lappa TaxID=4217 RepID=A0ACB9FMN6_ARCLA|nr:hypothetical protein L6452_03275 [Arctium lappa]